MQPSVVDSERKFSPFGAAWACFAPLALWLLVTKSMKVAYTAAVWLGTGPDYEHRGILAPLFWVMSFGWTRFAGGLLAAFVFRRTVGARRHFGLTAGVFAGTMLVMAVLRRRSPPPQTIGEILWLWTTKSAGELQVLAAALWREPMTIASCVLAIGLLVRFFPRRLQDPVVRTSQAAVTFLCLWVSIDLVYLITTGQPLTATVVVFSLKNLRDLLPLIKAEMTVPRALLILAGPIAAMWWSRRNRTLIDHIVTDMPALRPGLIAAVVGTLALFLPLLSANSMPYERYDQGSLIAFASTALSTASREAANRVQHDFDASGKPRWYSAGMKFSATEKTAPKNVVIVMMESMRAMSTTMHDPKLETTPFLRTLADRGLVVRDMNAIVPRTAGAWLAVLGGQYPLTNEGTKTWSDADAKSPRIRGLPSALRDNGYGTAFFTPTHLGLLNEIQVVRAMGFENIISAPELEAPGREYANYMGFADEVMVQPILDFATKNSREKRPFLAAIMTNIGHHSYETPRTWKPMKFSAPDEPQLQSYLNCLRYVDGVLQTLMEGFEKAGLVDDTIFVFVGDHGSYFGEHGINQVFNALYQEGVQVPAILYSPKLLTTPGFIDGPHQQIDFVPTIADLLGYRIDGARLPGTSLMAPPSPERELYFSGSIESSYLAVRYGQKKYIYDFDRGPMLEFDLTSDPREASPTRPTSEREESAKRDMLEWQAAVRLSMLAHPASAAATDKPWLPY